MSNKNKGFIPGLIVFLALMIFLVSLLWLSGKAVIISSDYRYYVEFDDVVGLNDMSPVYMRGYRVGWTKEIEFREDSVRVTVDIKKQYRFPDDSRVEISTFNLLGEKAITIQPGQSPKFLEEGAVVKGENKDLMTMAAKILTTAKDKLEAGELDGIIRKVSESLDGTVEAVNRMKNQIERLDVAMYNRQVLRLGEASDELRGFIAAAQQDTRRVAQAGQESMERFNQTLEQVDAVLENLGQVASEVRYIAQRLNRGEGTAGQLLQNKEFFVSLNLTLAELNAFLVDIKANPKKYVKFSIF